MDAVWLVIVALVDEDKLWTALKKSLNDQKMHRLDFSEESKKITGEIFNIGGV